MCAVHGCHHGVVPHTHTLGPPTSPSMSLLSQSIHCDALGSRSPVPTRHHSMSTAHMLLCYPCCLCCRQGLCCDVCGSRVVSCHVHIRHTLVSSLRNAFVAARPLLRCTLSTDVTHGGRLLAQCVGPSRFCFPSHGQSGAAGTPSPTTSATT